MAVAIALCVFEAVAVEDLPWLMKSLMQYLPKDGGKGEKEDESIRQPDSYIALESILQVIKAQKLVTDEGQLCVSLGAKNIQSLQNIWEQFFMLREAVVSWLLFLVEVQTSTTLFEAYQMVTALTNVILVDRRTAEKYIFPRLYGNSRNVWLLGNLLFKLCEKEETKNYWNELVIKWANSRSNWLWKSSFLAYALFVEQGINYKCENKLKEALAERIDSLRRVDIKFILSTLVLSAKVRTMFSEIMKLAYEKAEDKEEIILNYLIFLRYGFYRVKESRIKIPLLICDTKEQQGNLKNIISYIMGKNYIRSQLYGILRSYVKEITCYRYSKQFVQYLTAYFYNMSLNDDDNINDIIFFLRECNCKLAKEVYVCLLNVFQKRRKELLT